MSSFLKSLLVSECLIGLASCTDPAQVEQERFLQAVASNDLILLNAFVENYPNSTSSEKVRVRIEALEKAAREAAWIGRTAKKISKGNSYTTFNGRHYYDVIFTGIVEEYKDGKIKVLINNAEMITNQNNMHARQGFNKSFGNIQGKSYYWEVDDELVEMD